MREEREGRERGERRGGREGGRISGVKQSRLDDPQTLGYEVPDEGRGDPWDGAQPTVVLTVDNSGKY